MKQSGSTFKKLMALFIVFLTVLILLFIFSVTQSAIDVWEKLNTLPRPLFYTYIFIIIALILFSAWLIFRLLIPKKILSNRKNTNVSEESILQELEQADTAGVETKIIRQELEHLKERKKSGKIYVALFGDVSTGKSSIIKALLPDANTKKANINTDVKGGSTQDIHRYIWQSTSDDKLVLTDLPGRNEATGELNTLAKEEAIRAQIVIYVTDADLTRNQFQDIQLLLSFGKPLIVALNKSDRFSDEEKSLIADRFKQHFVQDKNQISQVFIRSGGEEEVVKIYPDGKEEKIVRPRKADINQLSQTLQDEIDKQSDALETLRDASVFVLVKQKLDSAKQEYRETEAKSIIKNSTRKAVLGALASVSPGSDLVIQGVLGTQMVKGLCALYDVPVRQLEIEKLLDFSSDQVKKSVPLLLAVAGNGMKAFPGLGTVTGGVTHAIAYGLIFDALGNAVEKTLIQRGKLAPAPTAISFKEMLSDDIESRAKMFAKLVLEKTSKR